MSTFDYLFVRTHNFKYPLMVKRLCCMIISGARPADCLDILQPAVLSSEMISKVSYWRWQINTLVTDFETFESKYTGLISYMTSYANFELRPRSFLYSIWLFMHYTMWSSPCYDEFIGSTELIGRIVTGFLMFQIEDGYGLLWNAFRKANFKDDDVACILRAIFYIKSILSPTFCFLLSLCYLQFLTSRSSDKTMVYGYTRSDSYQCISYWPGWRLMWRRPSFTSCSLCWRWRCSWSCRLYATILLQSWLW